MLVVKSTMLWYDFILCFAILNTRTCLYIHGAALTALLELCRAWRKLPRTAWRQMSLQQTTKPGLGLLFAIAKKTSISIWYWLPMYRDLCIIKAESACGFNLVNYWIELRALEPKQATSGRIGLLNDAKWMSVKKSIKAVLYSPVLCLYVFLNCKF